MHSGFIIFFVIAVNSAASRELPTSNEQSHNVRFHSYSGPLVEEAIQSKFSEARSLEIRLSDITGFSRDALQKLKNMESLTIAFSKIQKTEDNVFDNCCPKLKKMEIRKWVGFTQKDLKGIGTLPLEKLEILDENIPILKNDMFENKELKELRLIRDNIETIEPTAFRNLENLEYLLIAENKLKNFPKEALAPLKSLTSLELVSNGLKSLNTDDFPELPSLKKIIIINEFLKEVNLTDIENKAPNLVDIYLIGNIGVNVIGLKSDRHIVHNWV